MSDAISFTELAERVQALMSACRETDALIGVAVGWFAARKGQKGDPIDYVDIREAGKENWPGYGGDQLVPKFTEFFEDAMSIKPDNCTFALGDCNEDDSPWACVTDAEGVDYAATGADPILAFVAANLRARAALENSHG